MTKTLSLLYTVKLYRWQPDSEYVSGVFHLIPPENWNLCKKTATLHVYKTDVKLNWF